MRVISKRRLLEMGLEYADARTALQVWLETVKRSDWGSPEELRQVFASADFIGNLAIFNIKGNHYRLIVRLEFEGRRIYIKEFLTHAEYDRKAWMKWI